MFFFVLFFCLYANKKKEGYALYFELFFGQKAKHLSFFTPISLIISFSLGLFLQFSLPAQKRLGGLKTSQLFFGSSLCFFEEEAKGRTKKQNHFLPLSSPYLSLLGSLSKRERKEREKYGDERGNLKRGDNERDMWRDMWRDTGRRRMFFGSKKAKAFLWGRTKKPKYRLSL